jgi:hypothetical protein
MRYFNCSENAMALPGEQVCGRKRRPYRRASHLTQGLQTGQMDVRLRAATLTTIPEMKSLEKVQINLQETVKTIVPLENKGKAVEADTEHLRVGPIPDEIIGLLTVIEKKVYSTQ